MFSAVAMALCITNKPTMSIFGTGDLNPKSYVCRRAMGPLKIDGNIHKPGWTNAPWTDAFVDIEGNRKPPPRFHTHAKMLWDDQFLYIAAEMEEPQIWATLTERDSIIFNDNDFEIFLDPDNDGQLYAEIELNALNTVWDLLLVKPYRAGGPYLTDWNIPGLQHAVQLDGPINQPEVKAIGWSAEFAVPWKAIQAISNVPSPPKDGDQWRINFSRVEWTTKVVNGKIHKVKDNPEDNWVWSPHGVVDMHRPERWGVLQFSSQTTEPVKVMPLAGMEERLRLTAAWDAQFEFRAQHGRWAHHLSDLSIRETQMSLAATDSSFELSLGIYRLDHNQKFWKIEDR